MYNPVILVTLWNILCISEICRSTLFGGLLISWFCFTQNYRNTHTRKIGPSGSNGEVISSRQIVQHQLDSIILYGIIKIVFKKALTASHDSELMNS